MTFLPYAGPYHTANNSERGHKLTKMLYLFVTNKHPETLSKQLAEACDVWLAWLIVADLEAKHPYGMREAAPTRIERLASFVSMPRRVLRCELMVSAETLLVEHASVPEIGDIGCNLNYLYWALLQYAGGLFVVINDSLPRCPGCRQQHDSKFCPHVAGNLQLPLSQRPRQELRVGLGIALATKLQVEAESHSKITCMPWYAILILEQGLNARTIMIFVVYP